MLREQEESSPLSALSRASAKSRQRVSDNLEVERDLPRHRPWLTNPEEITMSANNKTYTIDQIALAPFQLQAPSPQH